jgi:hypothetical protein
MTEEKTGPGDEAREHVAGAARDLNDVGRTWAAYGLLVGKEALEQAAHAMTVTAGALARLADRLK